MQSSVGVAGTGWARLRLRLASGARGRANTGGSISSRLARCARVRPARGLCVCCAARTPKSQERVGGPNARRPRVELGASAATLALRLERWRRRKRRPGLEHESERGACDRGATGRAKGGRPGRARGRRRLPGNGISSVEPRGGGRPSSAPFQREGRLRVTADRHRGGRPGRVCLGPADGGWGEDSPRGEGPQSVQRAGDVVGQGRELDPQRGGEARHRGVGGFPTLVCLCRVLGCPCPGSLLPPRPFLCPQVSPSAWKSPGAPLHREEGGAKAASRGHHPTPHGGQIPSGGSAAGGLSAPWGGSPARPCSEGMATSGPGDTRGRDGNRSEQRRQALALRGSPAAGVRARLRPPSLCLPSAPPGGGKPLFSVLEAGGATWTLPGSRLAEQRICFGDSDWWRAGRGPRWAPGAEHWASPWAPRPLVHGRMGAAPPPTPSRVPV